MKWHLSMGKGSVGFKGTCRDRRRTLLCICLAYVMHTTTEPWNTDSRDPISDYTTLHRLRSRLHTFYWILTLAYHADSIRITFTFTWKSKEGNGVRWDSRPARLPRTTLTLGVSIHLCQRCYNLDHLQQSHCLTRYIISGEFSLAASHRHMLKVCSKFWYSLFVSRDLTWYHQNSPLHAGVRLGWNR